MAEVKMTPVISTNVAAAGFDPETGTLVVQFNNGANYSWAGVIEDDAQGLIEADSPGKYLRYTIEAKYGKGLPV